MKQTLIISEILIGCISSRIITLFRFLRLGGERKQHGKIQVHIVQSWLCKATDLTLLNQVDQFVSLVRKITVGCELIMTALSGHGGVYTVPHLFQQ